MNTNCLNLYSSNTVILNKYLTLLQTSRLQGQVAKLRAQVEQREATRQNLEYELTLAKKATSQEKRNAAERKNELNRILETHKGMKRNRNI